jgi:hypothetical protein
MLAKVIAIAVLTATAVTLTAGAAAGPIAAKQRVVIAKQRVVIQLGTNETFVLTPSTPGAIKRDSGTVSFCCWTERRVMRDGQVITINDPQMTLTGKRGTLVTRNRIDWVDVANGSSLFTGTWKVVRGTNDYAGLSGGGRGAGIHDVASRFEGFLVARASK